MIHSEARQVGLVAGLTIYKVVGDAVGEIVRAVLKLMVGEVFGVVVGIAVGLVVGGTVGKLARPVLTLPRYQYIVVACQASATTGRATHVGIAVRPREYRRCCI